MSHQFWDEDRLDRLASLVEQIADRQLQQTKLQTQLLQAQIQANHAIVRLESTMNYLGQVVEDLRALLEADLKGHSPQPEDPSSLN